MTTLNVTTPDIEKELIAGRMAALVAFRDWVTTVPGGSWEGPQPEDRPQTLDGLRISLNRVDITPLIDAAILETLTRREVKENLIPRPIDTGKEGA